MPSGTWTTTSSSGGGWGIPLLLAVGAVILAGMGNSSAKPAIPARTQSAHHATQAARQAGHHAAQSFASSFFHGLLITALIGLAAAVLLVVAATVRSASKRRLETARLAAEPQRLAITETWTTTTTTTRTLTAQVPRTPAAGAVINRLVARPPVDQATNYLQNGAGGERPALVYRRESAGDERGFFS